MFAFLFVLILRVPKLIRQTGIFSLKHFSLERKKKKEKKDKSKPWQRTRPTPAPGCKQQWVYGKTKAGEEAAHKAHILAFHSGSVRLGKADDAKT